MVDYSNHLPESAVRAVRQARAAGHLVYLCTGRSRAEMYPELWEMGIDGMIGGSSSPDVIAIADHVTDDVTRDGLYKAFEHYKLFD